MEAISIFLSTALGYILKSASESKVANTAKEELLGGFWQWVRPLFIEDIPEIENKADNEEIVKKTEEKLLELIKNEAFFNELAKRIDELQKAGVKEKKHNIVLDTIGSEEVACLLASQATTPIAA